MELEFRQIDFKDLPAIFSVGISTVKNAITMERLESDYAIPPISLMDAMARDVKDWLLTTPDPRLRAYGFIVHSDGRVPARSHVRMRFSCFATAIFGSGPGAR